MRNTDKTIQHYVTGTAHSVLHPSELSAEYDIEEDQRVFAYERYAEEIHLPQPLHHVDTSLLQDYYHRCLDMPLRLAGDTEYRLPHEWKKLAPLLEDIISVEHAHNPHWRDYHTYMTVDSSYVVPDEQQRHGGLHVDGFQGERIEEKTKITRNYVLTTNGGTRFYNQPFIVADPSEFNVFLGFDIQAEEYFVAEENTVYFMDAYTVHESGVASREGLRTFLRVTYDLKEFDRLGNTHNSALDYEWDMVARTAQDEVRSPRLFDIIASPYFPVRP